MIGQMAWEQGTAVPLEQPMSGSGRAEVRTEREYGAAWEEKHRHRWQHSFQESQGYGAL